MGVSLKVLNQARSVKEEGLKNGTAVVNGEVERLVSGPSKTDRCIGGEVSMLKGRRLLLV